MDRSSGVLLPVFSLPGPYGIGSIGAETGKFAEKLVAAGFRYWQVLPCGHTGAGNSPYQAFSAFAGNPNLIDLDQLAAEGLLTKKSWTPRDMPVKRTELITAGFGEPDQPCCAWPFRVWIKLPDLS